MSLLSRIAPGRARVLIGLAPAAVTLARLEGAAKPRIAAKHALECAPVAPGEPWQGAAAALPVLAREIREPGCDVTVVLSNHFVRYAVVPASETLKGEDEETAYARYCFAKVHGERARTWEIRLSGADGRSPRVASAIDAGLLAAIRACFPPEGPARLVSVQPYLMAAFNRSDARKGRHSGWLLLVEPQRACLACIEGGQWTAIHNAKGDYDAPERWAELLERERYVSGGEAVDVMVHAPGPAPSASRLGEWRFRALPGAVAQTAGDDGRLAMALCAA